MNFNRRHFEQGPDIPLILESDGAASRQDLIQLIDENSAMITDELHRVGGVLFRGFPLAEPEEFEEVAQHLIPSLKPYIEGQSPRTKIKGNVYTSTEYPAQYRITLHGELSYVQNPPERLAFFCHTPCEPGKGGETPVVDCRIVYKKIDPGIREKFENKGVKYVKNMHGKKQGIGKSWMDTFETEDRGEVERYLGENDIEFSWLDDGTLRTTSIRPAVRTHPVTGETLWFNQANLWHISNFDEQTRSMLMKLYGEEKLPTHAFYGDGSPISQEEMDHVRDVFWDESTLFPWQQGDLMLLDNIMAAHGRNAFEGPRRILVAMG